MELMITTTYIYVFTLNTVRSTSNNHQTFLHTHENFSKSLVSTFFMFNKFALLKNWFLGLPFVSFCFVSFRFVSFLLSLCITRTALFLPETRAINYNKQ